MNQVAGTFHKTMQAGITVAEVRATQACDMSDVPLQRGAEEVASSK
jgi:hypothetical protein